MQIKFNFFGKDCLIDRALANRSGLELALTKKNIATSHILMLNQVHGSEVVVVDAAEKIYGTQGLPAADAIVTNLANIAIGVITADCAPILFFDEERKIIAAAHAGWKGARQNVIQTTISAMKNLGAKNIQALIGPMIQQESYEVSQDFFEDFLTEDNNNKIFFADGVRPDKKLFDLPAYVKRKLEKSGITQIKNLEIDTYKNEADFFSFRRSTHQQQTDCGRNVSIITMN